MMGIHVNPIRSRALSPDYPENSDKMAASLEKQRGLKIIPNYFVCLLFYQSETSQKHCYFFDILLLAWQSTLCCQTVTSLY